MAGDMLAADDNAWQAYCLCDQVTLAQAGNGDVKPSPLLAKSGSKCTPLTNFPNSVSAKN
jgi:hypothetical protein